MSLEKLVLLTSCVKPSSLRLAGAVEFLHPKDWSSCVTVDPATTLTPSRSGRVQFLQGPSSAPWRPLWS